MSPVGPCTRFRVSERFGGVCWGRRLHTCTRAYVRACGPLDGGAGGIKFADYISVVCDLNKGGGDGSRCGFLWVINTK